MCHQLRVSLGIVLLLPASPDTHYTPIRKRAIPFRFAWRSAPYRLIPFDTLLLIGQLFTCQT